MRNQFDFSNMSDKELIKLAKEIDKMFDLCYGTDDVLKACAIDCELENRGYEKSTSLNYVKREGK